MPIADRESAGHGRGRDIFVSYYNRALTARRQPGSGFKPMAYLAALEAGEISPVTVFNDEPRTYIDNGKKWEPRNYGGATWDRRPRRGP